MSDRQKDRTCSTAVHALHRSDEGEWLEIAESLWEAGERTAREGAKAQIAAALAEGYRAGVEAAVARVENAARYYDGERARLLEMLVGELCSLLDSHPAPRDGGNW